MREQEAQVLSNEMLELLEWTMRPRPALAVVSEASLRLQEVAQWLASSVGMVQLQLRYPALWDDDALVRIRETVVQLQKQRESGAQHGAEAKATGISPEQFVADVRAKLER